MKTNTYPLIEKVLDDLGLIMIDRNYFGLTEQESTMVNTLDFIKRVCSEGGLMICTINSISEFPHCITDEVNRIKNFWISRSLPRYIIIPESVHGKYYSCITILFRRNIFFRVSTLVTLDDVYGSYLFDRQLVFKKPS